MRLSAGLLYYSIEKRCFSTGLKPILLGSISIHRNILVFGFIALSGCPCLSCSIGECEFIGRECGSYGLVFAQ